MHMRTKVLALVAGMTAVALLGGCAPGISTTTNSNGDSGSVITTGVKLINDQLGELNSAEWQILVTELPTVVQAVPGADQLPVDLANADLPDLTDAQAEALETFLDQQQVESFEDINGLAQDIATGEAQVPAELQSLWLDLVAAFS
jgi:hypothetical protein